MAASSSRRSTGRAAQGRGQHHAVADLDGFFAAGFLVAVFLAAGFFAVFFFAAGFRVVALASALGLAVAVLALPLAPFLPVFLAASMRFLLRSSIALIDSDCLLSSLGSCFGSYFVPATFSFNPSFLDAVSVLSEPLPPPAAGPHTSTWYASCAYGATHDDGPEQVATTARKIADLRILHGERSVLDAGAGSAPYADLFAHVTYETADVCLTEGKDCSHITYRADVVDLPVPDASYDLVWCSQTLEHVRDPDVALAQLTEVDPQLARIVELRYFAGLSEAQIAELLARSERSVRRDWQKARMFLLSAMQDS